MCGIIGYIGKSNAVPVLLEGLKRLEYRGYDSAGMAIFSGDKKISVRKAVGKIKELEKKIAKEKLSGTAGIAHTRWATHGHPTEANAHPHSDCAGKIWLAHNGIVENHQKLKAHLEKKGHKFRSQTDTEVISHLIEENYRGDLKEAVRASVKLLKGTYGLVVIHEDHPDEIVAAKLGSPMVIGLGKDRTIVASDPSVVIAHTKKIIYLSDGEIVAISMKGYAVLNADNHAQTKEVEELDWEYAQAEKGDFPDYMLKEIFEQPEAVRQTIAGRLKDGQVKLGGIEHMKAQLKDIGKLHIVGCGTTRCAGLVGEYLIEEIAGIDTEVDYASEFKYRELPLCKKDAVLAISQSGETADTKAAIEKAKAGKLLTIGIVNVVGSSIARLTDGGIYTHSGPEIAVASTKALTCQVSVLSMLASFLAELKGKRKAALELNSELAKIPAKIKEVLQCAEAVEKIAKKYYKFENFAFMGRKYNYPIALEGAIKLKEVSYIHAEAFPSGEMKHGPIAMIDADFPSVFICPQDSVYEKNISNIEEIKARGGRVIAIGTKGDRKLAKLADEVVLVPKTIEPLYPLLTVVPLQLLAYYVAKARGCDVDKPRNLAKAVTVE